MVTVHMIIVENSNGYDRRDSHWVADGGSGSGRDRGIDCGPKF